MLMWMDEVIPYIKENTIISSQVKILKSTVSHKEVKIPKNIIFQNSTQCTAEKNNNILKFLTF